mgnify:CR=1 FL=1
MENIILKKYGFRGNEPLQEISKGHINKIWKIKNGYKSFLLKEFNHSDKERLAYLINIENQLSDISPKIIKTANDKSWLSIDEKLYILYEYIDGKHFSRDEITPEIAKSIGSFLRNAP